MRRTLDVWLYPKETDSDKLRGMLVPAPDDLLICTAASPSVNSVKNDDPSVLRH